MAKHIFKCIKCDSYTMKEKHCGEKTINPKPARYSPTDKYGYLRRQAKEELE